jgi:hypothetical protein
VREGDEGGDDLGLRRVAGPVELPDERRVELQPEERQTVQVGQVRAAGAEVVDDDLDLHGVERPERVQRRGLVAHHGVLGELELELPGR